MTYCLRQFRRCLCALFLPVFVSVFLVVFVTPSAVRADEITVFAAASLRDALDEIAIGFRRQTGHTVVPVYAGSPVLARQIEAGAPADLFLSANAGWMDWLEARDRVAPQTRFDLAGNRLVLIGHGRAASRIEPVSVEALTRTLGRSRIAVAQVDSVPAGLYARASLQTLGIWDSVSERLVQADNVRAAQAYVTFGEVPFGIVYRSDALAEPRVSVLAELPADSHPEIHYPAALISGRERPVSRQFLEYLQGPAARRALARHGFVVGSD